MWPAIVDSRWDKPYHTCKAQSAAHQRNITYRTQKLTEEIATVAAQHDAWIRTVGLGVGAIHCAVVAERAEIAIAPLLWSDPIEIAQDGLQSGLVWKTLQR
jgi:hypothetical protein